MHSGTVSVSFRPWSLPGVGGMFSLMRSRWEAWEPKPSLSWWDLSTVFSGGEKTCTPATGSQHAAPFQAKHFSSITQWLFLHDALWLGHPGLPTLPWATSSLWAAEADLTRALVAAAMDLAASKICSSKSRVSSACYNGKKTKSNAMCSHRGLFLPNYLLLHHLALRVSIAFCWQATPRAGRSLHLLPPLPFH